MSAAGLSMAGTSTAAHEVSRGRPFPLGVTLEDDGVNIAVWAPEASRVWFCLFGGAGGEPNDETRFALPHRDGEIWHAHVSGVRSGERYGLRADGAGAWFDPDKLLIDPYAKRIEARLQRHPLMSGAGDSAAVVPKCLVTGPPEGPDPAANRPGHELAELVIYEAHAKGLTAAHPAVPAQLRGTYAGLAEPAILDHLTSLGVNAVELLPLQAFLDDQYVLARGLTNYWGYQPIAFLAPEPRYALHGDGSRADAELRALVHALHERGIEVIVDVVFNHSGEGDEFGPTLSFRGLHDAGYYRRDRSGEYVNDTGTGNTLAVHRPMVLRLVLDSLRHWAERYGIDGFRFDLAATLGRVPHGFDGHGFDAQAAFFQAVAQDPVLAGLKLLAEPWDIGPGGYRLGEFPHPWSEWNDRFRDGARRAWRGDPGGLAALAPGLLGSAERFDRSARPATASINFLTAHDGFTLADTVAYSRKHNEANGEGGRDGHGDDHSDNLGIEGPSDDPGVRTARARRVRAMLATLFVSQGVPMLLAGDELGNSQAGNNNAYAQDNAVGWVDWGAAEGDSAGGAEADDASGLQDFVRRLIALRRRLPVLRQRAFLHGSTREDGLRDVVWRLADGGEPEPRHWHDPEFRTVLVEVRGAADDPAGEAAGGTVLLILNTGGDTEVTLPPTGSGDEWRIELDTARPEASGGASGRYPALAQSLVVCSDLEGEVS